MIFFILRIKSKEIGMKVNLSKWFIRVLCLCCTLCVSPVFAEVITGTISLERSPGRNVTGAKLNTESVSYSIVLDENGKSLANFYEHKTVKVEGNLSGSDLTVQTWEEIRPEYKSEPVYEEPAREDPPEEKEEPEDDGEEKIAGDDEQKEKPADVDKKDEDKEEDEEKDEDSDSDAKSNEDSEKEDPDSDSDY
jgi:hypothetical protein